MISTSLLHNDPTANPIASIRSTSSATDDTTMTMTTIQQQNGVEPAIKRRAIQSEESSTDDVVSVAQYDVDKAKLPSADDDAMINQSTSAAAIQPKTILIKNVTTVGMQKASPTIRTSLKINGKQQQQQQQKTSSSSSSSSCVTRSGLTDGINDGINDGTNRTNDGINGRQSRVEAAAAVQPTNESSSTVVTSATDVHATANADEEDVDIVEYEVKQYVIEEIESTATVVINQPQTVRDLLEKVTSNPLLLGLVFLILGITLLCILAEGEISLAWTLFAISMASLIVFGGMKM